MTTRFLLVCVSAALVLGWLGCDSGGAAKNDAGVDSGDDSGTDTDADTDTETDTGTDDECIDDDPFDPADCADDAPPDPCVFFVDVDGADGDGLAWETALTSVQDGIDAARCAVLAGAETCQVWVAEGSYFVHQGCATDTIRLRPGVEVYGGFAGDETEIEQRNWAAHVTVLDGHADADGMERVYTVVFGSDDSALDGFTVSGGNSSSQSESSEDVHANGGGMVNWEASPVVRNCRFEGNASFYDGAGMWNRDSAPIVEGCVFENNGTAQGGGGGMNNLNAATQVTDCSFVDNSALVGGAVQNWLGANTSFTNCTFQNNDSSMNGGAIDISYSCAVLIDSCDFTSNEAAWFGGAVFVYQSEVDLAGSSFTDNSGIQGGAVAGFVESTVTVESCVFTGNAAEHGGAVIVREACTLSCGNSTFYDNAADFSGGALVGAFENSSSTVTNTIMWDNTPDEISLYYDAVADVTYSDVQGGYPGDGNIDADPMFVDPDGGDYCLQEGSPCIGAANDAGDMGYCPYEEK